MKRRRPARGHLIRGPWPGSTVPAPPVLPPLESPIPREVITAAYAEHARRIRADAVAARKVLRTMFEAR